MTRIMRTTADREVGGAEGDSGDSGAERDVIRIMRTTAEREVGGGEGDSDSGAECDSYNECFDWRNDDQWLALPRHRISKSRRQSLQRKQCTRGHFALSLDPPSKLKPPERTQPAASATECNGSTLHKTERYSNAVAQQCQTT